MAASVQLAFGAAGAIRIEFAVLTGADERVAASADDLLLRLATPGDDLVHGAALATLTMGDRDRALAGLYGMLYSNNITAEALCAGCEARYELAFKLSALIASRRPDGRAIGDPPTVKIGRSRVRLPRRSDVWGTAEDLLSRLTVAGPVPNANAAGEVLEAADPTLDFDLIGACPECGDHQAVPFSIGPFLEATFQRDLAFLAREVHLIASGYGWSLAEILSLSRAERQSYARLLIAEREVMAAPLRRAS